MMVEATFIVWCLIYIVVFGILMWQAFSSDDYLGYNKADTIWEGRDSNEKLAMVFFWPILATVMLLKGMKTLVFGKKVRDE